jgi:hypothetical protein
VLEAPPGGGSGTASVAETEAALRAAGFAGEAYHLRLLAVALQRAFAEAGQP